MEDEVLDCEDRMRGDRIKPAPPPDPALVARILERESKIDGVTAWTNTSDKHTARIQVFLDNPYAAPRRDGAPPPSLPHTFAIPPLSTVEIPSRYDDSVHVVKMVDGRRMQVSGPTWIRRADQDYALHPVLEAQTRLEKRTSIYGRAI